MNRDRLLGAVRFRHRGDADIRARLDFRHRDLGDAEHRDIVGHAHLHVGALARLHREQRTVDGFDGAANPDCRRLLGPRPRSQHGYQRKRSHEETRHQRNNVRHGFSPKAFCPSTKHRSPAAIPQPSHSGMVRRTRPQMCNCTSGNLEIPGSRVARPGMTLRVTSAASARRGRRWHGWSQTNRPAAFS